MEIKLYFKMLQRSWWIIVVTVATAIVVTLLISYYTPPIYRVVSRFVVTPNAAFITDQSGVLNSLTVLDRRSVITTYSEILKSPRIYLETLELLNMNEADLIAYEYDAVVLPDTTIIEFSVQGPDKAIAVLLANSIAQQAVNYVQNLYQAYDLTLLDPAITPQLPIKPLPLRDAGLAMVVGLALGVGLALIRELLSAPLQNFMQKSHIDSQSLALKANAFEERLENVAFASTEDLSLCIVHLEGLKDFIDVLPQSTLENILRNVNRTLNNQLRGNDLVGRWKDLEFSVLLFETPGDAAMNTMRRVRTALSVPIKIDVTGDDLHLNPFIGIAEYRVGDTAQSLIKNTDWALEMAKNNNGLYLLRATQPL